MKTSFLIRVELLFWDCVDHVLAKSRLAQTVLGAGGRLLESRNTLRLIKIIGGSAVTGFISGALLFACMTLITAMRR